MDKVPVTVIILTFNEEANIQFALESVKDFTNEIFIVDSFSTDKTLEIARQYTDKIYQNAWVHWAHQRNWALDNLPISYEWVFFLDADERLTNELCEEISQTIVDSKNNVDGYLIKRNFYFLGRWLKYGGYQKDYILRLIKKDKARSVGSGAREYVKVTGELGRMKSPMIHEDKKDLSFWIEKHINLARLEARETIKLDTKQGTSGDSDNSESIKMEHGFQIWLRENVWIRLPLFIRPFFYFFYRYFIQLGIIDGKKGFSYLFLQALWFPLLVDMMIEEQELKTKMAESNKSQRETIA